MFCADSTYKIAQTRFSSSCGEMSLAFISTLSKPFFLSAICMLSIKNDWIRSKLPKTGLKKGGHQLFDIFSAHESIIVKNYSDVINETDSFSGKHNR